MPFTGGVDLSRTNFASVYRKETQTAEPGYYAVTLDDNRAKVEIAAAKHSAIYRIAYQGGDAPRLFVDLQHGTSTGPLKNPAQRVISCELRREGTIRSSGPCARGCGSERTYHFALTFDRTIREWTDLPARDPREKARRFVLGFDLPAGGTLMAKFAISAKSEAGALKESRGGNPRLGFSPRSAREPAPPGTACFPG
jgi:putative alpha-1,2-mannosidase